eukprot:scaffold51004_cov61-Phaeocystis_antarctica.AAC.10
MKRGGEICSCSACALRSRVRLPGLPGHWAPPPAPRENHLLLPNDWSPEARGPARRPAAAVSDTPEGVAWRPARGPAKTAAGVREARRRVLRPGLRPATAAAGAREARHPSSRGMVSAAGVRLGAWHDARRGRW